MMRFLDSMTRGVVLAHNEGRRGTATVFSCAERDEAARLLVRAGGKAGAVSLFQGREKK